MRLTVATLWVGCIISHALHLSTPVSSWQSSRQGGLWTAHLTAVQEQVGEGRPQSSGAKSLMEPLDVGQEAVTIPPQLLAAQEYLQLLH